MSTQATAPKEIPPQARLMSLTTGHWIMQAIHVAARLGIADLLREGPRSADELARRAGAHPRSLYRMLRALAGVGVFAEDAGGRFSLTPMSECLRADVPGSVRAWALVMGAPYSYRAWDGLLHSVQTGEPAFDHIHGSGVFDYFARHPEDGRLFDASMTSFSAPEIGAVVADYDFSSIGTLVDVAGGLGSLLGAILQANPAMKGVVADLPGVIEGTRRYLAESGLAARAQAVPIDFFQSVPEGGDAYMMKHIIHDWNDERAGVILRNCHRAMAGKGKMLLIEMVIAPDGGPEPAKLDLAMLVYTGGCERTEGEYRDLLAASGFRLARIVPTASPVSVVEAVPV